jgi:cytochrome b561
MGRLDDSGLPRDRYTRVAIALHWAIAAFIVFNLFTGYFMEGWKPPFRFLAVMLHASSGLTVLALSAVRVAWRLLNPPPPFAPGMKPWERHAAHVAHFLLYAAMLLMPLTGWSILSAHAPPGSPGAVVEWSTVPAAPGGLSPGAVPSGGLPARPPGPPPAAKIWGLVPMPLIGPIEAIGREPGGLAPQHELHEEFVGWHSVGSFLLMGLLVLHLLGALKHQFLDRQSEFARMGIGRGKRS